MVQLTILYNTLFYLIADSLDPSSIYLFAGLEIDKDKVVVRPPRHQLVVLLKQGPGHSLRVTQHLKQIPKVISQVQ